MTRAKMNVERLVYDLGGPSAVAKIVGTARTAPYGWIRRGYIGSPALEKIKTAYPQLDLNYYFEESHEATGRSA